MGIRKKLYQVLENRKPAIRKCCGALGQQNQGGLDRRDRSESSLSEREPPGAFARRLAAYDVIAFEVFDTLLFRSVSCPTDLFLFVGEALGYPDFEKLRRETEWRVRQKTWKERGSYEVSLEVIYEELEKQAGIPKERGMQAEIAAEEALCFANPYMLEVFRHLQRYGKRIICVSDMYLPAAVIRRMVEKCGYQGISDYYVSCEQGTSKADGSLFEKVREDCGRKRCIHVGNHPVPDKGMTGKHGFKTELYLNVNAAGMPYRAEGLSALTGSLYRGLVNAHLHNGLRVYSREYELGFVYGGLFAVGYCQFIHEYAGSHGIDRILFLSQDGDILDQVYGLLYPKEAGTGKTAYVYWSGLAAAKMGADYFKHDYFRLFVDGKVNQGYTLQQIFEGMELEDMLASLCWESARECDAEKEDPSNRPCMPDRSRLTPQTCLTDKNAEQVKEYLKAHWQKVLSRYEGQVEAGRRYYKEVLQGIKKAAAVNVGGTGSGAVILDYMVNKVWGLDCEVVGILGGFGTIRSAEPDMSKSPSADGKLVSCLDSHGHNRDLWKWHDAAKDHDLNLDLLCSSAQGSLKGFYLTGNGKMYELRFRKPDVDRRVVEEIQRGIRDFAGQVVRIGEAMGREWRISGKDWTNKRVRGSR